MHAQLINFKDVQLGPIASWVSALLTVGTLFMSLRLYRRDYESRRREQAHKINAWPDNVDTIEQVIAIKISNSSDEPVYNVSANVNLLVATHPFYYDWCATWHEYAIGPSSEPLHYSEKTNTPFPEACKNPPLTIPQMAITLSFTDASGISWQRD